MLFYWVGFCVSQRKATIIPRYRTKARKGGEEGKARAHSGAQEKNYQRQDRDSEEKGPIATIWQVLSPLICLCFLFARILLPDTSISGHNGGNETSACYQISHHKAKPPLPPFFALSLSLWIFIPLLVFSLTCPARCSFSRHRGQYHRRHEHLLCRLLLLRRLRLLQALPCPLLLRWRR
jgi:hypothetical protein